MLKHIPKNISPELMKVMMEMGHGDELVIGDGNFPAASCAKRLVRCDGQGTVELLDAIMEFFPLDCYSKHGATLMEVVKGDNVKPTIWEDYKRVIEQKAEDKREFEFVERFDFYERAKKAYVIISTSEPALYANIILKKGVC